MDWALRGQFSKVSMVENTYLDLAGGKRTTKEHTAPLPPSFTGGFHKHYVSTLAWPPLPDLSAPFGSMDPSRDSLVNEVDGCGPLTPVNYLCVLGKITFSLSTLISSSLQ